MGSMLLLIAVGFATTQFANAQFPYGRCYVPSCDSMPYQLVITKQQPGLFCFTINSKPCRETHSVYNGCCREFDETLNKIVVTAQKECKDSLSMVTVDGVRKGGGVFFDVYSTHGEVRITSLFWNKTRALGGREVCLHLRGMCEDPVVFCRDNRGLCRYAIFDPVHHICCPTCDFSITGEVNLDDNNTPSPPPEDAVENPWPQYPVDYPSSYEDSPPPPPKPPSPKPPSPKPPSPSPSPDVSAVVPSPCPVVNEKVCRCECGCS